MTRSARRGCCPAPHDRSTAPSRAPLALVRVARLGAPPPPVRHARRGARRAARAARRADRRGQDARRLPAHARRADRGAAQGNRGRSAPHALHLAAQGARGRRPAQPARADRGDGAADPRRDAHRRHALRPQVAPAHAPARDPAHHARITQPAAVLRGQPDAVFRPQDSSGRRGPRLRHRQARRPARSGDGAAPGDRAGAAPRRALGDGRRSRRLSRLAGAARRHPKRRAGPGREGRRPAYRDPAPRRHGTVGRPFGHLCDPAGDGRDRRAPHDDRVLQHARARRAGLPAALEGQRGQAADRCPPRQPVDRGAAARRAGDGRRPAARAGRHRQPRSRGRLGRRRLRDPDGRAQGIVAAAPADRPRQPPARRGQRGDPRPGNRFEYLEAQAALDAVEEGELDADLFPRRRARRAGAACDGLRLRRAVRCRRNAAGSACSIALFGAARRDLRARAELHRRRRLRAARL